MLTSPSFYLAKQTNKARLTEISDPWHCGWEIKVESLNRLTGRNWINVVQLLNQCVENQDSTCWMKIKIQRVEWNWLKESIWNNSKESGYHIMNTFWLAYSVLGNIFLCLFKGKWSKSPIQNLVFSWVHVHCSCWCNQHCFILGVLQYNPVSILCLIYLCHPPHFMCFHCISMVV